MASVECEAARLQRIVDCVANHAEPPVDPHGINPDLEAGHGKASLLAIRTLAWTCTRNRSTSRWPSATGSCVTMGASGRRRCTTVVQNSGVDWTVLRCSWFNQNFSEGDFLDMVLSGEVAIYE
jgi:hypothetical protein